MAAKETDPEPEVAAPGTERWVVEFEKTNIRGRVPAAGGRGEPQGPRS